MRKNCIRKEYYVLTKLKFCCLDVIQEKMYGDKTAIPGNQGIQFQQ